MNAHPVASRSFPEAASPALFRLVEQGRLVEAVDEGAALLDTVRDPALEAWLLELRHEAWAQWVADHPLPRPVTSGDPYPGADGAEDPFPGHEGLVEISSRDLSAAVVAGAIRHHGALLVRGLLRDGDAETLRHHAVASLEAQDGWRHAQATGEPIDGAPSSTFTPFAPRSAPAEELQEMASRRWLREAWVSVLDAPRAAHDAGRALEAAGVRQMATELFGARPAVIPNKWSLRRNQPGGVIGWHQEHHVFKGPTQVVNLWVALTPCGEDAPGLSVFPTRPPGVVPCTPTAANPYKLALEDVLRAAGGVEPVTPVLDPGDALVFDDLTLHRTQPGGGMEQVRRNMETWLFLPSAVPPHRCPALL